ncbi:SEFIR domain protein [Dictyocaulus viviparus]|uniref:SEFIR domain protein n=1 Tax=Dictyocaulus viviparus TaxID=29172 RepID=A0A0D8Y8I6_DICVI|nr:SEFIR domain protein [Dictyocaulus viviparus]
MRKIVNPKFYGRPSIGLALFGCTNRPFYQICVFPDRALGRRYEGLSGLFPIHPKTFIRAKHNRASTLPTESDQDSNKKEINFDKNLSGTIFRVLDTSKKCIEHYESLHPQEVTLEPPLCPTGLLSVDVGPIVQLGSINLLPHIELNVSITMHEHVDSATIRLQCLYAPDAEDIYCHDVRRMTKGSQWLWPCRAVVFYKKHAALLPFHFGYSCFRMFGLSQYMINVTVFPQNCRSSLLVASPTESQLSPDIAMYYSTTNVSNPDWSPLLIVDLSENDGVWLRVEGPPSYYARLIEISLFERQSDGVLRLLQTFNVVHPSTGLKWRNVARGEYVAYAHIPRHDCALICGDIPSAHVSCHVCTYTVINFTLTSDKASISWIGLRRMRDSSLLVLASLAGAVTTFAVFGIIYVFVLWHRTRHFPVPVREIELHEKPSILLLTPDDCIQHSNVVLSLGCVLEKYFGVTVLSDHKEIISSGLFYYSDYSNCKSLVKLQVLATRPYKWIVDSICRASHVLIIVSPCSQLVLDGQQLQQRRPFPDLFVPAIGMIIREYAKAISSNKYIICRLPYSPATCSQLAILGLPEVEIPSKFCRLATLIHSVNFEKSQIPADCPVLYEFMQAVKSMVNFMEKNEDWVTRRLNSQSVEEAADIVDVPAGNPNSFHISRERTQTAEKFGLLPPEENEEIETSMTFTLLPKDSDDE